MNDKPYMKARYTYKLTNGYLVIVDLIQQERFEVPEVTITAYDDDRSAQIEFLGYSKDAIPVIINTLEEWRAHMVDGEFILDGGGNE